MSTKTKAKEVSDGTLIAKALRELSLSHGGDAHHLAEAMREGARALNRIAANALEIVRALGAFADAYAAAAKARYGEHVSRFTPEAFAADTSAPAVPAVAEIVTPTGEPVEPSSR